MSEMVERVAQAICGDDNPDNICSFHRIRARLAIKAMREATADMIDAGRDIGPDAPYGLSETIKRWQAMIDEALR